MSNNEIQKLSWTYSATVTQNIGDREQWDVSGSQ